MSTSIGLYNKRELARYKRRSAIKSIRAVDHLSSLTPKKIELIQQRNMMRKRPSKWVILLLDEIRSLGRAIEWQSRTQRIAIDRRDTELRILKKENLILSQRLATYQKREHTKDSALRRRLLDLLEEDDG